MLAASGTASGVAAGRGAGRGKRGVHVRGTATAAGNSTATDLETDSGLVVTFDDDDDETASHIILPKDPRSTRRIQRSSLLVPVVSLEF